MLADAAGVARLLALQVSHRLRERLGRDRPADPPAGHRVGLADAGHDDRAVGEVGTQRGEGDTLPAVVHELVVDFVRHHREIVLDGDVGQGAEFIRCVDDPGRVTRRAEQEHSGPGRDRCPEGLGTKFEVVLDPGFEQHRLRPRQLDELRIAHPVRRGHDHFVALVEHRGEDVVEGVFGPVGDDDLTG